MRKERELIMETRKSANIGARLDRLPNSGWHIKMWLVTAFALLVCWSNGIGGSVQNILLNELHWLEPGTKLLAMWGTTYTAGQLFGALVGGPIGDKIGRKKSILLYEIIHIGKKILLTRPIALQKPEPDSFADVGHISGTYTAEA